MPPMQTPPLQYSLEPHAGVLHEVPSGSTTSAGHEKLDPVQRSAGLHSPPTRHCVVDGRYVSGHAELEPVQ